VTENAGKRLHNNRLIIINVIHGTNRIITDLEVDETGPAQECRLPMAIIISKVHRIWPV
jgi:hypothetical protein